MLYDPKWEKQTETKADPYSLAGLIAWLERQPADRQYDWPDTRGCLICMYLQEACGFPDPRAKPGFGNQTIKDWGENGYFEICRTVPWTFGAALARAREAQRRS